MTEARIATPKPDSYVGKHRYSITAMGSQLGSIVRSTATQAENHHWNRTMNGDAQRVSSEQAVKTSGTREKRYTAPDQTVITMAVGAAQAALGIAAMKKVEDYTDDERRRIGDIGTILINSSSPYDPLSPLGPAVAHLLGASNVETIDVRQTCAAIPYMLKLGAMMVESGAYGDNILLITTDDLPKLIDPDDYGTASLFGAGAAAMVLSKSDDPKILGFKSEPMGDLANLLKIEQGGSGQPVTHSGLNEGRDKIFMDGPKVFEEMCVRIPELTTRFLNGIKVPIEDIDHVVVHPGSGKVEKALRDRLKKLCGIDGKKVLGSTLSEHGNMSAASTIVTLMKAYNEGKLFPGDYILIIGFGAGMHASEALIEWTLPNPKFDKPPKHKRKIITQKSKESKGHRIIKFGRGIKGTIYSFFDHILHGRQGQIVEQNPEVKEPEENLDGNTDA